MFKRLQLTLQDPTPLSNGEMLRYFREEFGFFADVASVERFMFVCPFYLHWEDANPNAYNMEELMHHSTRAEYVQESDLVKDLNRHINNVLHGLFQRYGEEERDLKDKLGLYRFPELGQDGQSRKR